MNIYRTFVRILLQWKLKQMDQLPLPKKEMDYEY